jgi:hypothetical protein
MVRSRLRADWDLRARLGGAAGRLYEREFEPSVTMRERLRSLLIGTVGDPAPINLRRNQSGVAFAK